MIINKLPQGGGKRIFKLTVVVPTGVASVTVNRTSSPIAEASIGIITADNPIFKGDVLATSGVASGGYDPPTGITYAVSGDTTATVTAGAVIPIATPLGYRFTHTRSDPSVERLGDAVGKTFRVASSLSESVVNDFDNLFPFNQIEKDVNLNGRIMAKFPKTYVKYLDDGTYSGRMVTDGALDSSYKPHPIFLKGNKQFNINLADTSENYNDYVYIAKYYTSGNTQSTSGSSPQGSATRSTFRNWARSIGSGWSQLDVATMDYLQMLWLLASGTRNSQSLMLCNQSGSKVNNGGTDGAVSTCVQISNTYGLFYGIENAWSGIFQWVDGININNRQNYICTNINNYVDDTTSNYLATNYANAATDRYIRRKGYDSNFPFVQFPIQTDGSSSTYWCDYYYFDSGWRVVLFGGYWDAGSDYGFSFLACSYGSSDSDSYVGSRLIYRAF